MTDTLHVDGIERVLVCVAHPDDCDFGCAGSVARWTDAGVEVTYCIVTDGQAGGFDESVSRTEMARIRRDEQRAAAAEVGVREVVYLGYMDGMLTPTIELRRDISRVIRQCRPDRVLSPSPERSYMRIQASHPDHLAAGEATICAVYPDSRNPFAHPELLQEGLRPHTVRELWLMAAGASPDAVVDVTDSFERKVAALNRHHSQIGHRDPNEFRDMLRSWSSAIAKHAGLAEGRLAEGFRVVPTA